MALHRQTDRDREEQTERDRCDEAVRRARVDVTTHTHTHTGSCSSQASSLAGRTLPSDYDYSDVKKNLTNPISKTLTLTIINPALARV